MIPEILESVERIIHNASFVKVNEPVAKAWATSHQPEDFPGPSHPSEFDFHGDADSIANLCLLLDCLNFCYWSKTPWIVSFRGKKWNRTYAMYASIYRAIQGDRMWLSAKRWATADDKAVEHLFRGDGQIPLLPERRAVLNETGQILHEKYDGSFSNVVQGSNSNARDLAYLLAEDFPSFRDVASHQGHPVAFLKRAQICAADLHRLWQSNGLPGLTGMDQLTVVADYRLPQYLRHVGILELDHDLAARVGQEELIAAGSPEEVELRAATIWAGEIIRRALGGEVPAWKIEFVLWQRSHDPEIVIRHHRTKTCF